MRESICLNETGVYMKQANQKETFGQTSQTQDGNENLQIFEINV